MKRAWFFCLILFLSPISFGDEDSLPPESTFECSGAVILAALKRHFPIPNDLITRCPLAILLQNTLGLSSVYPFQTTGFPYHFRFQMVRMPWRRRRTDATERIWYEPWMGEDEEQETRFETTVDPPDPNNTGFDGWFTINFEHGKEPGTVDIWISFSLGFYMAHIDELNELWFYNDAIEDKGEFMVDNELFRTRSFETANAFAGVLLAIFHEHGYAFDLSEDYPVE